MSDGIRRFTRRPLFAGLLILAVAACSGTPSVAPEPTGQRAPTSFAEYAEGFCSAMLAMTRAIGNPDTGADSDLSFVLEAAIEKGDLASATETAAKVRAELQTARREASRIAGWPEGADPARQLDRFLAALEVYLAAMLAAAPQGIDAARTAGQQAFEAEGAITSWTSMFEGLNNLATTREQMKMLDCGIPPDPRDPSP